MNTIELQQIAHSVRQIEIWGCRYHLGAQFTDAALPYGYKHLHAELETVISRCKDAGLHDAAIQIELLLRKLKLNLEGTEFAAIRTVLLSAYDQILLDVNKHKFVRIEADRSNYVDNDRLFGDDVWTAFPSASDDIKDAGNCLAAECATAAVFHLMRVAEIGLRALAYDRSVTVLQNAKAMFAIPLELATWEPLIKELEGAELEIQKSPKTTARTEQFEFYHGANMQVRAFKNVFRNAVMHTRDSYDRDEAISVCRKVEEFMKILASKIAENVRTPRVWT